MSSTPKLKGLFEIFEKYSYYEIPMLVGGGLNLDLHTLDYVRLCKITYLIWNYKECTVVSWLSLYIPN